MSQLADLARPIPKRLIEPAPKGRRGSYVPHFVITQALLAVVGPFDFEITQILRGQVAAIIDDTTGKKHPALENVVVGVVCRLTVMIDGRRVSVEEAGSVVAGGWEPNDGERLKKATSDAVKRCGMRLGLGIHLWCKRPDQFFLPGYLAEHGGEATGTDAASVEQAEAVTGVEDDDEKVYDDDNPARPF